MIDKWSFSRLKKYENCPASVWYGYVERRPDPPGAPALLGKTIHSEAEAYLRGDVRRVPKSMQSFGHELRELRRRKAKPEAPFYVNSKWQEVESFTWLVAIIDAWVLDDSPLVVDFKTGKERREHEDQMELYGAVVLSIFEDLEFVEWQLWYTATGTWVSDLVHRDELEGLQRKWDRKAKRLLTEEEFPEKPGRFPCAWCAFNVNMGGPCEAGAPYPDERK